MFWGRIRIRVPVPPVLRRADRWLLLRAPLLWRVKLPHSLLALALIIAFVSSLLKMKVTDPGDVPRLASTLTGIWLFQLEIGFFAVLIWMGRIVRRGVDELPLHRHVVTLVAVTFGSYLWLAAPGWLANLQMKAIARIALSEELLQADRIVVTRYDDWYCVPATFDQNELNQLRAVLERYYGRAPESADLTKRQAAAFFCSEGDMTLGAAFFVPSARHAIDTILISRGLQPPKATDDSPIYFMRTFNAYWLMFAAFVLGLLTVAFSYPRYVWLRTFGLRA
jgi:hypothetical protein